MHRPSALCDAASLISEHLHGSSANLLDLHSLAVRGLSRTRWRNRTAAYDHEHVASTYMPQRLVRLPFCIQLAGAQLSQKRQRRGSGVHYVELVCLPSFATPRNPCFKRKHGQVMPCFPHLSNTTGFLFARSCRPICQTVEASLRHDVDVTARGWLCRLLAEPRVFCQQDLVLTQHSIPIEDQLRTIDCVNTMRA
jgi:hypothetical protein